MTDKDNPITLKDWHAAATRLFGPNMGDWIFKCPLCKHEASVQEYRDLGDDDGMAAFSCIGRLIEGTKRTIFNRGKGPCDYAGGGLFKLNPIHVRFADGSIHQAFEFGTPRTVEQETP